MCGLDLNSIEKLSLQDKPDVTVEFLPEETHNKNFASFLNMHSIVYGKLSFCKSLNNNSKHWKGVGIFAPCSHYHFPVHVPYSSLLREV